MLYNLWLENKIKDYEISQQQAQELNLTDEQIKKLDICIVKIEELEVILNNALKAIKA